MARSINLKPFYFGLGAVAVAGGAWIWMAKAPAGGTTTSVNPDLAGIATGFEGYLLGADSAPVEVIEYADFQCPACAQFAILTMPDVRRRLINTGLVRWRFRDFPLPMHDKANVAHLAAACAGEQGRFWEMHDQLYYNHGVWVRERRAERKFRDFARAVGVELKRYDACIKEGRYAARIAGTKNDGVALGVSSTPTLVIGGLMVAGSIRYDSLRTLVDRARPATTR